MSQDLIEKTKEFMKKAFIDRPHYSFGHWSVMYDHSLLVQKIALQIAENIESDKLVVSIGALLHDIGKTFKTDPEILHKQHEKFNLKVCGKFLDNLGLTMKQSKKLKEILSYKSDSVELKIIEDADTLALYADKRLYMLYIEWASKKGLKKSIQRKIKKFYKLHFIDSKKLGKEWFEQIKKDWKKYMT